MGEHGGAGSKEAGGAWIDTGPFFQLDVEEPAYTCYPQPSAFDFRVGHAEYERRLALAAEAADQPIELHVHLPFQGRRHLHGARGARSLRPGGAASNLDFVRRELERVSSRLRDRRRVSRLHLSGTPTFYAPRELTTFVADLFARFPPLYSAELTIEMDPRVTTEAHLAALATFGFDHAWIGVEDYARPAGTEGGPELEIGLMARALRRARAAGFSSLAVDLVCGLAHHTSQTFDAAVATAVELGFDRVAIRSVARRPSAAPQAGELDALGAVPAIDAEARHRLLRSGFEPIGLDHFVRSGDRLAVARRAGTLRRSLGWYTAAYAGDCVGLGVGALSDVAGAYFQNARRLDHYEYELIDWSLPVERGLVRDADDEIRRRVVDDLLLHGRVDASEIRADLAIELADYFAPDLERLRAFEAGGLVKVSEQGIEVLPPGRPFARELVECFDRRLREPRRDENMLAFRRRV